MFGVACLTVDYYNPRHYQCLLPSGQASTTFQELPPDSDAPWLHPQPTGNVAQILINLALIASSNNTRNSVCASLAVTFPMAPINLLFFLVFFVILKDDRAAVIQSKSMHCSSSEISAEFAVGCELSRPSVPLGWSKQSAIVPTTSWTKANASLRLTKWFLIAQLLLLCAGDVSLNPGPSGLKFCHWNVQRLTDSKLEELKLFVTNLHSDVDALIITETFCQPKIPDSYYSIPGFNLHRKDRVGKSGGGIMAWIRNSLEHKRRMDLGSDIVEALWLEVFPYKSKRSLLTAGVYRPPSNNAEQDKMLGINIENAYLLNKEMILLGDFNVNFLSYIDFKKHHLVKILHSLNLTQVVNSITRPLSKTCLDHIWCSHPEHLNNISVIPSGMSDHLPIVATRKYNRARSNNSRYNAISYRDIKNLDKDAFVESLETAPWDCAFVFDDINDIVDAWYKILKAVVNEHLPLKQKRVKRRNQPKW